jgi:hypothetical protein
MCQGMARKGASRLGMPLCGRWCLETRVFTTSTVRAREITGFRGVTPDLFASPCTFAAWRAPLNVAGVRGRRDGNRPTYAERGMHRQGGALRRPLPALQETSVY